MTLDDIAASLARAATTARHTAQPAEHWPDYMAQDHHRQTSLSASTPTPPTQADTDHLSAIIAWLQSTDDRTASILWMRAQGYRWRTISDHTGCVRHKAYARWISGLTIIAQHLRVQAMRKPKAVKVA